eukprot:100940_1
MIAQPAYIPSDRAQHFLQEVVTEGLEQCHIPLSSGRMKIQMLRESICEVVDDLINEISPHPRGDKLEFPPNIELDVQEKNGVWHDGIVIERNTEKRKVKLHYVGYPTCCDFWLNENSSRMAPKGTYGKFYTRPDF